MGFIQNTNKRMVEINLSLGSVNEKLLNNDQITEEINGVLEQHQDDIKLITSELESLKKSMSNADTTHLESVEKMKELTIFISNIKEQIMMQEEKISEKSTNDSNEMKSQFQVIQNDQDMSSKKLKELDNGSQSLLEKLISLEKDIGERCDDLDKTDENLLSMITKLGNDNNTQVEDLKTDFSFRISDLDKRSVENDHATKTETTILKHDLESLVTQNTNMLTKISDMDNGNQQMLEKLLNIETDFNGKVVGVSDNAEDLKLMIINVDSETKNNSQGLINIQESLNIQAEQVKKVESERQKSAEELNKTFVDKIDANAKAVADLRKGLSDSINILEVKLKQDMDTDQQNLEQKILLIQNKNDVNLNKITALETSGPETTKTLLDNFEGQFKDLRNVTDDKVNEIEGLLSKNTETIKVHASQIEIHSENINSFVSSNAVFSSQISAVETKSDDFIKYLEVERQRIDNIGSDIKNLDENLGKAVPEIKKNSDKLLSLDVHIENFNEFIQNTNKRMVEINISLGSVNEKLLNNEQITEEINGVLEQHQDDIKLITSELESLKKSMLNADTNHLESVEKMKELTIIISNIKEQIIMQEEKITEKSINDFNEMKSQIQVIQNDQDMSSKKIKELDNGSQSLLDKLISLEKDIGERCDDLDKTDENLLSMITKLGNDNNTQVEDLKTDFSFRITDQDKRSVENDHATKTDTNMLKHDLESVVTQNTNMLTKISDMDNGNQQMLEKLLSIETDFNGKVVGVSDNAEDLKLMIINVDRETKNNSQGLIN